MIEEYPDHHESMEAAGTSSARGTSTAERLDFLTTTAAGNRPTNEHNGKVGGYRYPVDLAIAPDGNIFVLSRGNQHGMGQIGYRDNGRVGKTTFDEHHLGDFARREFTWPAGIAVDSEGWVYVSDEHENLIRKFDPEATHPFPAYDPDGEAIATFGESGSEPGRLDGPTGSNSIPTTTSTSSRAATTACRSSRRTGRSSWHSDARARRPESSTGPGASPSTAAGTSTSPTGGTTVYKNSLRTVGIS